jgi:hypothetical protein
MGRVVGQPVPFAMASCLARGCVWFAARVSIASASYGHSSANVGRCGFAAWYPHAEMLRCQP